MLKRLGVACYITPPDDPTAAFLIGSHGLDQDRAFRKHRSMAPQLAGYLPADGNGEDGAKIPVVAISHEYEGRNEVTIIVLPQWR